MKKIFRKAITVLGSAALIGATVGAAAAAAYPAPFTSSNTAIVVGSNAATTDVTYGSDLIATNLDAGSTGTAVGNNPYQFEKSTAKFHLGNGVLNVVSTSLDDDELPTILAKGNYVDDDNDEFAYKQKIDMANLTLGLFDDNDYERDTPTVGFEIADDANILNYTMDFTTMPLWSDLTNTDLEIMGKTYYILSTSGNDTLNLLDSAQSTILSEEESKTVSGKDVSINFISTDSVKLTVDGETTNSLSAGGTYKLSDGSYVGIKEINVQDYAGGMKQVEFSLGSGKLAIADNTEVEMNGDDVTGLTATITNGATNTKLDTIVLQWNSDEKSFITPTSSVTMPGLKAISLSYTGMNFPAEEDFVIEADGENSLVLSDFPMEKDTSNIHLLYTNGTTFTGLGYDSDNKLATSYGTENLTFTKGTHDYFVLSYQSGDTAESYLVRAASFDDGADDTKGTTDDTVKIEYKSGGSWVEAEAAAEAAEVVEIGSASMTVESVDDSTDVMIVSTSGNNNFHMLYSAEGLEVYLPWINETAYTSAANDTVCGDIYSTDAALGQLGYDATLTLDNGTELSCESFPTTYTLMMEEEDKDGSISDGNTFNFTVVSNANTDAEVSVTTVNGLTGNYEVGQSTKEYLNYLYGALATKVLHNTGGDQDYATVTYHGGESYGAFYASEAGATTSDVNVMRVTDTEVSTAGGMNLIVVGGSAINTVAADLLGGAYSEGGFTSATDVGAGEFLIQSFSRSGKTALLVAGYNAADTQTAVTYLLNKKPNTDVGAKLIGTSATEATVVTA